MSETNLRLCFYINVLSNLEKSSTELQLCQLSSFLFIKRTHLAWGITQSCVQLLRSCISLCRHRHYLSFLFLAFRLSLKSHSGTAGRQSSLVIHGADFSTKDMDNDNCMCKCSLMLTGGKRQESCAFVFISQKSKNVVEKIRKNKMNPIKSMQQKSIHLVIQRFLVRSPLHPGERIKQSCLLAMTKLEEKKKINISIINSIF